MLKKLQTQENEQVCRTEWQTLEGKIKIAWTR